MREQIDRHGFACERFSVIVQQAGGHWDAPSPCSEWDARGVVEHVIGFHDALLLRPTGNKPERPKGDEATRWAITVPAILFSLEKVASEDSDSEVDLHRLLPVLTADVVVHTWDLAKAVGVDPQLDPGQCEVSLEVVRPNDERLRKTGMFGEAVPVPEDADSATRLVAFLGRDPAWTSSSR
jgi:uncharacterized protein (TIGR03086 family)